MGRIVTLDVSDLPAPEPLQRVLDALAELQRGDQLCMLHRHEPLLLYQYLDELDFSYRVEPKDDGPFEIWIWHTDRAAHNQTRAQ